jgi:hypothetical protein
MKKIKTFFSLLGRLIFPWKNLSGKNRRRVLLINATLVLILVPTVIYSLSHLMKADAAWFNSNWAFRKSIAITAHTSAETNVYINLTGANAIDTSDATRFQADCGDLRFTDINGKNLPYYIVSGCGTGTTVVHVFFQSMPAGAQTIYYYYGNPSAENGFRATDFSTEASSYTIGSQGTEEAGVAPIAHWKFDDGQGTTAVDSSSNKTVGTLNSFDTAPSTRSGWMKDDQCLAGKCLLFNGTSSYVSTADRNAYSPSVNSISVSFWAKIPTNATASGNGSCGAAGAYMVAKGNTSNWEWGFENDNNTLLCLDLFQTSGTAYKLISVSRTMNDGQWHHYAATIEPGTLVTLYVDGVLVTSANSSFNNNSGGAPTPTRAEIYQDLDKAPFHTNSMIVLPEDKDRLQKEGILGNLIKKLPYDGKYFSLDYDYENDSFNLSIDAGNRLIAEEELKLFLNLNKISGKEVLQNLNTSSR